MNKILLFFFLALCQIATSEAFEVEARVAYFYPQDKRIRDLYGKNGFANYQIEAAMPLDCCCDCACNWDIFTNLGFYEKSGRTSCLDSKTKVTNWTLNFGVKRFFDMCECFRPYLGLGAGAAHVKFHDQSEFVRQHTNRWGVALLVKSGVIYDITCNFFLDAFVDYSYEWYNFHSRSGVTVRNVNTGGLKTGLGLGYRF